MRKTLLLVFIHGFKGGDDTFGSFPEHLRALTSHALPQIDVIAVTYPKFETRGDLKECVARFREWLENKVIDLEVARSTPSPMVTPSVHIILIGHSMGGIVAAETYLSLAAEQPLPPASFQESPANANFPSNTTLNSSTSSFSSQPKADQRPRQASMFPHIQGILAFDTPYLGLAPGMVAHGIEGGHKVVSNAYNTYSEVASIFGWGSKSEPSIPSSTSSKAVGALPAPNVDAAAAPKWQSWGKYAMFAGAAGAVVAGGAAALYSQREKLTAGWQWASDHLLFVGELFKPEYLRKRVEHIESQARERKTGLANLYTNLGKGAMEGYGITSSLAGKERTFCNLPVHVARDATETRVSAHKGFHWVKVVNDRAKDETTAHMSMFYPRENPGFYSLGYLAKDHILAWVDGEWYESSSGPSNLGTAACMTFGEVGDGWEKPDYDTEEVRTKERERDRPEPDIRDWEGVDKDVDDFRMREDDDLRDSVVVERASNGEIPLPPPRQNTGGSDTGV